LYLSSQAVREKLEGKTVAVRIDADVPLTDSCKVADDSRLRAALPTLDAVLAAGASRVIVMAHLGRPKGKRIPEMSLLPAAMRLAGLLPSGHVVMAGDCVGPEVRKLVERTVAPFMLFLENLRFHPGEEEGNELFVDELVSLFPDGVYVFDAFGSGAKPHASCCGLIKRAPLAVAGLGLQQELDALDSILNSPRRPLVLVLGGKKVSDKIGALTGVGKMADCVLVGGLMAIPLLAASGCNMGSWLCKDSDVECARAGLNALRSAGVKVFLPLDLIAAKELKAGAPTRVIKVGEEIPKGWVVPDIGPKTLQFFEAEIAKARTVIANFVMGAFETEGFAAGTFGVADALAANTGNTYVGGGDSILALQRRNQMAEITHVFMGGGSLLAALEGGELPCVTALNTHTL